jgi:hypothetical protein
MTTARTAGVIAAVVATALVVGLAMQGFAASQTTSNDTAKPKTITVTSTATVSTSPDIAVFDVSVRGESADGSQAFDLAARKAANVLRAVRGAGVAQKDLTTLSVGLNRQVIDRGQSTERTVYVASQRVEVVVRDLDSVGAVLDAAVAGGADGINDIRFDLGDTNAAQTDALAEAVTRSRAKADAIAQAAGSQVTGLLTVTEGRSRRPFVRTANTAYLSGDFATRIVPPNELDTRVTVTVVWSVS